MSGQMVGQTEMCQQKLNAVKVVTIKKNSKTI